MTLRFAAAAAAAAAAIAVGAVTTAGCSKQSTAGDRPTADTTTSARAQPPETVDMASAVRQWYQRAASISKSRYFDPRRCGLEQPAKIWLLGGGAPLGRSQRSCAVPVHEPILAPVVNYVELAAYTSYPAPTLSPPQMSVTLDGKPLTPLRVTNSRPYSIVSAAPGNPVDFHDGTRIVDDGYWVLIDPGLTPGRHHLNIHASETPARLWTLTAS